ncbi:Type I transmembrane sorting receptor [Apophysomyces ossiformis]|uniref:rhizopuspepsin n=1 Tax=Apophysomyces ossiformis TaxID=679940 RepID=A0A8H7BRP5_9FUNG|nr:Type I transmembrane sorting receptor [Apophysomyces ossiformis]
MKISACIAALLAVATFSVEAAPVQSENNVIRVALESNPNFKHNTTAEVLKVRNKYSKNILSSVSDVSTGTIPMTDYQNDVEYYGTVKVGTPPVSLKLDFDTGSSDLWFASTLCSDCSGQTLFNPDKSSTYQKDGTPWQIGYGDGSSASGIVGYDTVNLGGLDIKHQAIELAKEESSQFQGGPIDGLLGLAFDTLTSVAGIKTPVDNLISQGLISKPIFGVFLGKESTGGGGEYVFGGYDESHIGGPLTTVPIDNSDGFWGITIDSTTVGGKRISGSFSGILDTGTTLLILPTDVLHEVAAAYNAKDVGQGTYTISCDVSKLEPLKFSLAGTEFEVPSESLIFEKQGNTCYASFSDGGDSAIFGDVFIKNNYVIFNQEVPHVQIAPVK